jgi:hypothetical protein
MQNMIHKKLFPHCLIIGLLMLAMIPLSFVHGQGSKKVWIDVGSLQNWYSNQGWEIEEGYVLEQQYGLTWPSQFNRQHMQAAKGIWFGVTNFTDERNVNWTNKVVHIGPRVNGLGEFFPIEFKQYSKFPPTTVSVDGNESYHYASPTSPGNPDRPTVDPNLPSDRMLYTKANTAIGLTFERKIHAFTQRYHDNYFMYELILTNTGNVNNDNVIELPTQTLTNLRVYIQHRYSVVAEIRYMVNNSAGWGINSMNDFRGYAPDKSNARFPVVPEAGMPAYQHDVKMAFTWHGRHPDANKPAAGSSPNASTFDNIGAPIFDPSKSSGYIPADDTVGWRLGGAQFVGNAHIHCDKSPTDTSEDVNQPSTTTGMFGSDSPLSRNNSMFNSDQMKSENETMAEGHVGRHAWVVEPAGKFNTPTADPANGTPGGYSSASGYGPFTLGPGQSIRILYAEGASGLSRDECISVGKKFKYGTITNTAKNDSVFKGVDRLLQTFRRAQANFALNMNIPRPPYPPATFDAKSLGDGILLTWTANTGESDNGFAGYRVYRALSKYDSTYRLVAQFGGTQPTDPNVAYNSNKNTYTFTDRTAIRGVAYYYYIASFGSASANTGAALTPAGELESSMFYTRTYDPAYLLRPACNDLDSIRIVPNPWVYSANQNTLLFPGERDKIAFLNIPGYCSIKIYTELGELIRELDHTNGSGDQYWDLYTTYNQLIVSGVYIAVIEDKTPGRPGNKVIKKLVVVR